MAERAVSVEFVFDRASAQALAQAYRMLVPERRARTATRRNPDGDSQPSTASPAEATRPGLVTETGGGDRRAVGA